MKQNAIAPAANTASETAIAEPLREQVRSAIAASRSPRTLAAYESRFRAFTSWASAQGLDPLPAEPETVAAHLADLAASGKSVATVKQSAAAIAYAHRTAGSPNPCESEGVRRTVAGIARQAASAGRTAKQATAINGERLAAINATLRVEARRAAPATAAKINRDAAILAVMRDGMLRRSEVAALRWADLDTAEDGTGRLTIRRSKTDQAGEGAVLFLHAPTVAALAAIRNGAAPDDPIFALSPSQIHRIVRGRAAAAGIAGAGGHSLRVGSAQDLAAKGAGLPAIQQAGRWSDPKMVARYCRQQSAARGAVARFLDPVTL